MRRSFRVIAVFTLCCFLLTGTYSCRFIFGALSATQSQSGRVQIHTEDQLAETETGFNDCIFFPEIFALILFENLTQIGFPSLLTYQNFIYAAILLYAIILDPPIIQVPDDASNFRAVVGYPPNQVPLVMQTNLDKVAIAPGEYLYPEPGNKLVILELPENPGFDMPGPGETPIEVHFEFEFDLATPRDVTIKVIPAGKILVGEDAYYPAVITDMADGVPFTIEHDTRWYSLKVDGDYVPPELPRTTRYDFTSLTGTHQLYFCHVADSAGVWDTELGILNDSNEELNGSLIGKSNDGAVVEIHRLTLPAHGRREIDARTFFTNPGQIGYAVFESEKAAKGYQKFWIDGQYRVAVPAVPDTQINQGDSTVAHIASNQLWTTSISLVNTTTETVVLSIEFSNGDIKTVTLGPLEHQAFSIRKLFGSAQPNIESAIIRNAAGVIGLELFAKGNQLAGVLIKDDTALVNYYPHTASNNIWWTGIVGTNVQNVPIDLTVTPYTDGGTQLTAQTIPLVAGEKYMGAVQNLGLPAGTAWLEISGSMPFTGFELFGTNDGNRLGGYTGVNIAGMAGCFVKLEKNGWTGIAFVNIEDTQATVTLTAYDDTGAVVAQKTLNLPARSKKTDTPEKIFQGTDISAATYMAYTADRQIVGFQLNNSTDNMLLDALPRSLNNYHARID